MKSNYIKTLSVAVSLLLCIGSYQAKAQYDIKTICGNNYSGYSGDGGPASAAELNTPMGLCMDKSGNIYITDIGASVIRKIDNSNVITTIAGIGSPGYSGDGGPATAATFYVPEAVLADTLGNIYVADTYNYVVRKIDAGGIITTIAGNGINGYSGDGGLATAAELKDPTGLALDGSGNLLIADYYAYVIRKLVISTGKIYTIAGTGINGFSGDGGQATAAELNQPNGVSLDKAGNIYISDTWNQRIRKISGGIITTIAGNGISGYTGDGGPATSAELYQPMNVLVDASGNLDILDHANSVVRMIDLSGKISTIGGDGIQGFCGDGGPAVAAEFFAPFEVVDDNGGNLYITDTYNFRVREMYPLPLATEELSKNVQVTLYPNPNQGIFTIQIANSPKADQPVVNSQVEIYNMLGEKIYSKQFNIQNSAFKIDISNQPNGIYILKAQTADGNAFVKRLEIIR